MTKASHFCQKIFFCHPPPWHSQHHHQKLLSSLFCLKLHLVPSVHTTAKLPRLCFLSQYTLRQDQFFVHQFNLIQRSQNCWCTKFSSKSNFWKVLFLPQCVLLPLLFAESRGLVFWPISFGKMQIKLSVRRSGGRMCVEKQREVLLPAELVLFLLYLLYQEQNCIIKVVHHRGRYTISPKEPRKLFSMRT